VSDRFFVDTSGWYAFLNAGDPRHKVVKDLMGSRGVRLATSTYVFDELVTLVQARVGHHKAVAVGNALRTAAGLEMLAVSETVETASWNLFAQRGGRGYSFTDCTSFVLMQEFNLHRAVTLDQHFMKEGFETPCIHE
jgi:predicted nucleic acid-binding protein